MLSEDMIPAADIGNEREDILEIIRAKHSGFCFGVDRAVNMAYKISDKGIDAATLGQLIHNTYVTNRLADRGVGIIDFPSQSHKGQTVIIRAHGVSKSVYDELNEVGAEICDATCPFVKKIHTIVSDNSDETTPVLIAGDPAHPEVMGIKGYCKGQVFVFKNLSELENILRENEFLCEKRIIIVSQTTFSQNEWKICKEKIKILCTNPKIFDTICFATRQRQDGEGREGK